MFEGVISALPTPFKNGEVDLISVKKMVAHQLSNGIQGFVVNGTTGESPVLSADEIKKVYETVHAETQKQVPILVGTGTNSTQSTIEKSIWAEKLGADGLLIVTPYYNKPPQRGLVAHYKAVAEAVRTPIVLYNVPGRTAVSMTAETVGELSRVPNIVGIKEATADMKLGADILKAVSSDFNVTSGDDFTFLDLANLGGKGVISVLSNVIPKECVEALKKIKGGQTSALSDFKKYWTLTELLFVEANPIPVKSALKMMGIFEKDEMRLPLVSLADDKKERLREELQKLQLLRG